MDRKKILLLAGAVLLAALVAIWLELKPPASQKFNPAPIIGIGQVLAEETVQAVHDRGHIVVVRAGSGSANQVMPADLRYDGFLDELKKHPAISIAATEFVAVERLGLPGCETAAFKDVCNRHASADALVFFLGLPSWVDVSSSFPKAILAKVLVADTGSAPSKLRYGGYFASGFLTALISLRIDQAAPGEPKTPREFFERQYQVYTPQNYETLPN